MREKIQEVKGRGRKVKSNRKGKMEEKKGSINDKKNYGGYNYEEGRN